MLDIYTLLIFRSDSSIREFYIERVISNGLMSFVTINWELKDGRTASTQIPELKVAITLEKLNQVTKAWVNEN